MKTIVVYHSRDLDGWMSAAIVQRWFLKNYNHYDIKDLNTGKRVGSCRVEAEVKAGDLDFLGWDYGDEIPDLSSYNKVIMVDVAFPVKEIKKIHINLTGMKGYLGEGRKKQPSDFIWIDHHVSAIKEMEKEYPIGNPIPISLPFGFRDTKFAACELTWNYFFSDEKMPEIVRLLGRYDCLGHEGTDEEQKVLEFQYGARAYMNNYEDCYKYLIDSLETESMFKNIVEYEIQVKGKAIYKYLCTEARQIYKKAFPIMFQADGGGRLAFLCVNQERFNPINFDIDYHKGGYDGFACFWFKNNKWSWSLYNDNGEVDCSVIAKRYNGGGHFSAAGMVIDTKTLLQILT